MPYFFICPIYVLLIVGLLILAFIVHFIPKYQKFSSYIVAGAVGTIPGFLIANVIFWVLLLGIGTILNKSNIHFEGGLQNLAIFGGIAAFVIGLAAANIAGCILGFLVGIWFRKKTKRKA